MHEVAKYLARKQSLSLTKQTLTSERKGRAMSRVKITCEIHDYSEPSKPNIRIHSHWNEDTFVELEINDERYTVSAEEITRAIYNASNGGR